MEVLGGSQIGGCVVAATAAPPRKKKSKQKGGSSGKGSEGCDLCGLGMEGMERAWLCTCDWNWNGERRMQGRTETAKAALQPLKDWPLC